MINIGYAVRLIGVLEEVIAVSKANNNEQIDADILQCKADILRARDIIPGEPPYKKKTRQEPKLQKTGEDTAGPADAASTQKEKTEIPRFDLAEAIMAEQRKITAIRRKAPGKKNETEEREAEPISHTIEQAIPTLSEQEQIVAEIVARDIEKMCRGDYSADSM